MKNSSLYSTYGAYELKAVYQWNMLKSNGIITTIFMLIFIGLWIASLFAPPTVIIDVKTKDSGGIMEFPPLPRIIPEYPAFADKPRQAEPLRVGIPTPIPDEEAPDNNMVIPDRDQLSQIVDDSYSHLLNDSGVNYAFNIANLVDDELPEPDSFIAVDRMPEMVYHQQPEYPRMAREMGITGLVYIQALIEKDGTVLKVNVKKSSQSALLDESAVKAAYKNKYSPAILKNNPVRIWVAYKVVFELD